MVRGDDRWTRVVGIGLGRNIGGAIGGRTDLSRQRGWCWS